MIQSERRARRWALLRAAAGLFVGASFVSTACGGDESAQGDTPCVPGATAECFGPGQCTGAQICKDDGSGFGPCDCGVGGGTGTSTGGTRGTGGSRSTGGTGGTSIGGTSTGGAAGSSVCGNGIREGTEACDGSSFGPATCASVSLDTRPYGPLRCTSSCTLDTSLCSSAGTGGTSGVGTGGFTSSGGSVGGLDASVDGSGGTPSKPDASTLVCAPQLRTDPCEKCIESACCTEWLACGMDADCTGQNGELAAFQACMVSIQADAGYITVQQAQDCLTNNANNGVPATASQDLVTCILGVGTVQPDGGPPTSCGMTCYGQTF